LVRVTVLAARILRWLLDFWKFIASLLYDSLSDAINSHDYAAQMESMYRKMSWLIYAKANCLRCQPVGAEEKHLR